MAPHAARTGLDDIADRGAAAACAALERLSGRRVTRETQPARVTTLAGLSARDAGTALAGASVRLRGPLRGAVVLAFPVPVARALAAALLAQRKLESPEAGRLAESALKELANIAAAGFVTHTRRSLGIELDPSVPTLAAAGWDTLVRYTFLGSAPGADLAWAAATRLAFDDGGRGELFLLLDARALGPFPALERAPGE